MLISLKHSISIIWEQNQQIPHYIFKYLTSTTRQPSTQETDFFLFGSYQTFLCEVIAVGFQGWRHFRLQYLVLPRDGDTACDKLWVEVVICGVKVHAFDSGELLYVQDVFTVHGSRLRGGQKGAKQMEGGVNNWKNNEQVMQNL